MVKKKEERRIKKKEEERRKKKKEEERKKKKGEERRERRKRSKKRKECEVSFPSPSFPSEGKVADSSPANVVLKFQGGGGAPIETRLGPYFPSGRWQDRRRQEKTWREKARQDKTGHDRERQHRESQDRTRQD